MFGEILLSTVNIYAYEFRVYSFLYVIKYMIVNDCFCHLCGVILTLNKHGCDIGAQYGTHTLSSHKLRADIYFSIHSVPVL